MPELPRVALLIETSTSYGRSLLRGVRRYMAEHGPWSLFVESRSLDSPPPAWLEGWQGHGILARSSHPETAQAVQAAGLPVVELRSSTWHPHLPFVGVDNQQLGHLAAQHLLERGFRYFAALTLDQEPQVMQRCESFTQTLAERGYPVAVLRQALLVAQRAAWEHGQLQMVEWLRRLPKPIGVLACSDQLGFWLLDACQQAGLAVPEDVAVIGVEDDQPLCEMAQPMLSSVRLNGVETGYQAASLLARLMQGEPVATTPILIPPQDIMLRQSSDIVALPDPQVAAAVTYIRQHACRGLSVQDVLNVVPMSRSSLERRMKTLLGRSPAAEITRVRLERVKQLLHETNLTLAAIADRTGFEHPQYLSTLFKQTFGETPGEYRQRSFG